MWVIISDKQQGQVHSQTIQIEVFSVLFKIKYVLVN
jgi:hypothetical protein